ncbi:MAG: PQQ-dependent sugar dehydrogenase [Xanthomonadales bacterium]
MPIRERTPFRTLLRPAVFLALWLSAAAPVFGAVDLQFTPVSPRLGVVDINHAGDGSGRLFLVAQSGSIIILRDGEEVGEPFLDITDRVETGGERGLLSVAFAPDYAASGLFYVWYTGIGGDTVLSRFAVGDNPDRADPASEQILLEVEQPYSNHNGGRLRFGPDGMLYLGLGDGGSANDPLGVAQDGATLLGKLIRIDVDPQHEPYAVPADNPFLADDAVRDEIWATGLRNPWRIAFDRATGDLFIADVGQSRREEINVQPEASRGGENYGWSILEGSLCLVAGCDATGLTLPVFEYGRDAGCSVTGGEVYRGRAYPDLSGVYLFGDYCEGTIWGMRRVADRWETDVLATTPYQILTFGEAEDGAVYLASANRGVFLLSDGAVSPEPALAINPGMNDAWFDPATNGQGVFVNVFPDQGTLFLGWFTYDVARPDPGVPAVLGEPGHRWLTAQGPYSGDAAQLVVSRSTGGVFDSAEPVVGPPEPDGTVDIHWIDCRHAMLRYDLPAVGRGAIPLRRIVSDNAALCEALQESAP